MIKYFCLAVVLFVSFTNTFAQRQTITKNEFDKVYQNGVEKLKGKSYRVTAKTEGNPLGYVYYSEVIAEIAGTGSERTLFNVTSDKGQFIKENIAVGGKIYLREDKTGWQEVSEPYHLPLMTPAQAGMPTGPLTETEYKFLGAGRLNNEPVNVYKVVEKVESNKFSVLSYTRTETKYWFAEDGRLLKSEAFLENTRLDRVDSDQRNATRRFFERNEVIHSAFPTPEMDRKIRNRRTTTTIYELDPAIKIEAPIK